MILGVIIQVTSFKGHKAMAQFIIGRTITGVGNGIVNIPNHLVIETLLTVLEHIYHPNVPSRV